MPIRATEVQFRSLAHIMDGGLKDLCNLVESAPTRMERIGADAAVLLPASDVANGGCVERLS